VGWGGLAAASPPDSPADKISRASRGAACSLARIGRARKHPREREREREVIRVILTIDARIGFLSLPFSRNP
jgi:hypothetical protein